MTEPLRSDRAAVVQALAEQLRRVEGARWGAAGEVVSSGLPALDALLAEGGFRRGALVEWLSASPAGGAATLALASLARRLRPGACWW